MSSSLALFANFFSTQLFLLFSSFFVSLSLSLSLADNDLCVNHKRLWDCHVRRLVRVVVNHWLLTRWLVAACRFCSVVTALYSGSSTVEVLQWKFYCSRTLAAGVLLIDNLRCSTTSTGRDLDHQAGNYQVTKLIWNPDSGWKVALHSIEFLSQNLPCSTNSTVTFRWKSFTKKISEFLIPKLTSKRVPQNRRRLRSAEINNLTFQLSESCPTFRFSLLAKLVVESGVKC